LLSTGDVAVGLALLALVLGSCAWIAWLVVERWLPWLNGLPRVLTLGVCVVAAMVLVHLLPGALGLFLPGVVAVLAVLLALAVWRWLPQDPRVRPAEGGAAWWEWAPAVVAGGCALALLRELAGAPITSIDAQNFQVPIVARWIQTDSLWGLHQFIADYSNATYPQNGNLLVAAVMLSFDSSFLARLVAAPSWALAGLGGPAGAREVGAPRAAAALAGGAFALVPVMAAAGLEGVQTDPPMLAMFAAGVLFLLRHARTGERRELVLAGVALGLAFGTKWYAVTTVFAVLVIWLVARRRERPWRDAAVLVALIALAGGFWMLRNLVEASNPMFPQPLGPFPAPPDPLRAQGGFTLAHYLFDWDVWRTYLWPSFRETFGTPGLLLLGAGVLAAAMRPRGAALAVLIGAVVLAGLYFVTPYSAFGPEGRPVLAAASTRYGLPALMGFAVLAAWIGRRAVPVLVIALLAGVGEAFDIGLGKLLVGMLMAAVLVVLPRRALPAVAVVGLVALVLVSASRSNDQGYGQFDPTLAWIERHAPSGARIGVAGVWSTEAVSPVLPAFGPRLGNRVEYVGEFREHMLRRYRSPEALARGLAGLDLLLVGAGSVEAQWSGWSEVARSDRLVLLRPGNVAGG
jgi:hypothetical protein